MRSHSARTWSGANFFLYCHALFLFFSSFGWTNAPPASAGVSDKPEDERALEEPAGEGRATETAGERGCDRTFEGRPWLEEPCDVLAGVGGMLTGVRGAMVAASDAEQDLMDAPFANDSFKQCSVLIGVEPRAARGDMVAPNV